MLGRPFGSFISPRDAHDAHDESASPRSSIRQGPCDYMAWTKSPLPMFLPYHESIKKEYRCGFCEKGLCWIPKRPWRKGDPNLTFSRGLTHNTPHLFPLPAPAKKGDDVGGRNGAPKVPCPDLGAIIPIHGPSGALDSLHVSPCFPLQHVSRFPPQESHQSPAPGRKSSGRDGSFLRSSEATLFLNCLTRALCMSVCRVPRCGKGSGELGPFLTREERRSMNPGGDWSVPTLPSKGSYDGPRGPMRAGAWAVAISAVSWDSPRPCTCLPLSQVEGRRYLPSNCNGLVHVCSQAVSLVSSYVLDYF